MSNSKPRVLFVSSVLENVDTGPGKFAKILYDHSDFDDIEMYFLSEDVKVESNNVFNLRKRLGSKKIGYIERNILIYKKLHRLNKVYGFDIVWCNFANEGLLAALLLKRIVHVGMINDDSSVDANIFKRTTRRELRYWLLGLLESLTCRIFDKIIVNSNYLKKRVSDHYQVDHSKVCLLYKSVEIPVFSTFCRKEFGSIIKLAFMKSDFLRGGVFVLVDAL